MNDVSKNPFQEIVEIDETQLGKRKYNVGRIASTDWFFGVCDAEKGGRVYIVHVDQRDKRTLIPIIHSLVDQGTIIMSDGWASYDSLDEEGFPHLIVNHSIQFVEPTTGANTQRIESLWASLKGWMREHSYRWTAKREEYIQEWCWRYNHEQNFLKIWETILH
jgi:transposase-like protein